jgi:hypothetical protein
MWGKRKGEKSSAQKPGFFKNPVSKSWAIAVSPERA